VQRRVGEVRGTRLRVFLRFLHVEGEIDRDLTGAVPSVASWRLAGLVKALDAGSLARLLASCDRRTRVGRRDFAVYGAPLTMWRGVVSRRFSGEIALV